MNILVYDKCDYAVIAHCDYLDLDKYSNWKTATMTDFFSHPDPDPEPKNIFIWTHNESLSVQKVVDNIQLLQNINCPKYLYIDDLHWRSKKDMYAQLNNHFKGIFFSYAYCVPRYLPFVKPDQTIWLPAAARDNFVIEFNNHPIEKIILSGQVNRKVYPMRQQLFQLRKRYPIDVLSHPGNTTPNKKHDIVYEQYAKYINQYLVAFACCSTRRTPYIVRKFFEIPATGALLLAFDHHVKPQLLELGYIDGENYISVNHKNLPEKIQYVLDPNNRSEIDRIRKNGQELVKSRHMIKHRLEQINRVISKQT